MSARDEARARDEAVLRELIHVYDLDLAHKPAGPIMRGQLRWRYPQDIGTDEQVKASLRRLRRRGLIADVQVGSSWRIAPTDAGRSASQGGETR